MDVHVSPPTMTYYVSPPPTVTAVHGVICPDLLRLGDLGEADGWRGRAVRVFFRVLRIVTGL